MSRTANVPVGSGSNNQHCENALSRVQWRTRNGSRATRVPAFILGLARVLSTDPAPRTVDWAADGQRILVLDRDRFTERYVRPGGALRVSSWASFLRVMTYFEFARLLDTEEHDIICFKHATITRTFMEQLAASSTDRPSCDNMPKSRCSREARSSSIRAAPSTLIVQEPIEALNANVIPAAADSNVLHASRLSGALSIERKRVRRSTSPRPLETYDTVNEHVNAPVIHVDPNDYPRALNPLTEPNHWELRNDGGEDDCWSLRTTDADIPPVLATMSDRNGRLLDCGTQTTSRCYSNVGSFGEALRLRAWTTSSPPHEHPSSDDMSIYKAHLIQVESCLASIRSELHNIVHAVEWLREHHANICSFMHAPGQSSSKSA
ncbi:hypothetical protein CYME_CMR316C [Cyanidioschyzon merolae strain 10D]|uniref:HSF-type DNA-binding domain-containing protein n=1 Tax=Cyanidioschyzon merolae (strain NIES-3377 / 10D) TaxID=280699 RepID=M1UWE4_CYAM1|nr:hypothetical protein CYME_CMR316C [Cyanidioschyzon merolae strain 10D]BAM82526.1 hypothetical protein CYME_CMR316C [Cyanidioschyzon merolae strain 10D]|eukprot:XP_005538562.1 hypothetical protein CYME_CMR316C [Cyanidioschyzon merolae strain 10D]